MNDNQLDKSHHTEDLQKVLQEVLSRAYRISVDVGHEVEDVLRLGKEQPLNAEEARQLLSRAIEVLRSGAGRRGDMQMVAALEGDLQTIVERIYRSRADVNLGMPNKRSSFNPLIIANHNGIETVAVRPSPWFHGKEIPMTAGFVRTADIKLWEQNERLDIHLNQFRATYGRIPKPEELLEIMLSKLKLPGIGNKDAFEITELARSIASNGVRKPPILDTDGTLLDGNRRVTACYYILNNDEFTIDQKKRAEHIFCWQLTEHATDDDRNRVVVSLNFESDCKQDWPQYVKARKVFEAWMDMLGAMYPTPNAKKQAEMKRELSQRFALGPNTTEVNRFLRMVQWADDFEEYHMEQCKRDPYEVKHRANEKFQYFDELSKGVSPGTVAHTLNEDESLKHLAFDLLYQKKFKNWTQIRDLRYIANNMEARDILRKARDLEVRAEDDLELAQDMVEEGIAIVRAKRAEERSLGANTRIEAFVKFLEDLPIKAFRDEIKPENLQKLLKALSLIRTYAEEVLGRGPVSTTAGAN